MIPVKNQNMSEEDLYNILKDGADFSHITIYGTETGYTRGIDLGSRDFSTVKKPEIAILVGEGIRSYDAGEIWHLLDTRHKISISKIDIRELNKVDLSRYTHFIIPSFEGSGLDSQVEKLKEFVREGGTIIGYRYTSKWLKKNKFIDVEFLEKDITGIEPRDATHLGLCRSFQISQVFMTMSVKQNLMIAMSLSKKSGKALLDPIDDEKISKECDDILELYKIKNQSENIVSTLSQGIRKLLDIAMAVVGNPKVILLDEPTSGVSVEEKFGIMDIVIAALKQSETSVLFVEHDMEIVERYVDRVIAFYQGEIICDAPPKEALSNKKVIEYVLGH